MISGNGLDQMFEPIWADVFDNAGASRAVRQWSEDILLRYFDEVRPLVEQEIQAESQRVQSQLGRAVVPGVSVWTREGRTSDSVAFTRAGRREVGAAWTVPQRR
jgi:hypothetical protein